MGQRSQVTLKTAYTVCFAVLSVVAVVTWVMRTTVALTLTGISALLALSLEHGVSWLERRRLPRMLAIAVVMMGLLVALALLVVPVAAAQVDALVLQWPQLWEELRGSRPFRMLSERLQSLGWSRRLEDTAPPLAAGTTVPELVVLGVPYFLPLGIASGFSSMVPYAGPVIAGGFITLLTWATGGMWMALGVLVYFVLYGQLEGNVLAPLVFRRTVHVSPLIVLLAVLFCAELAGVVGAVVAVPVAAAAQIVTREVLLFRRERRTSVSRAPPGAT